jgi:hypothetical protein
MSLKDKFTWERGPEHVGKEIIESTFPDTPEINSLIHEAGIDNRQTLIDYIWGAQRSKIIQTVKDIASKIFFQDFMDTLMKALESRKADLMLRTSNPCHYTPTTRWENPARNRNHPLQLTITHAEDLRTPNPRYYATDAPWRSTNPSPPQRSHYATDAPWRSTNPSPPRRRKFRDFEWDV